MIPAVVLRSIEIMKQCFGGIEIDILDNDMSRKESSLKLGLSILVSISNYGAKHRVFLGYQECEDICACGESVANEYVYLIIKDDIVKIQRKLKLQKINAIFKNS